MSRPLLTPTYLGHVQYFSKIAHYGAYTWEAHGHYLRQTYRTRCTIASASGTQTLTIPVERGELEKPYDRDIRIATTDWQKLHWGAIEAAYRKSPFLDYLADDLHALYARKYTFLWDFLQDTQAFILDYMNLPVNGTTTNEYNVDAPCDFRNLVDARHPAEDPHFQAYPYYQVFQDKFGFLPNLSALDLLLNMGPEGLLVLHKSYVE